MDEGSFQSDRHLDPLQESIERLRTIVRQSPGRVVLVVSFIVVSFVVVAALSGIIESFAATWVQTSASDFLGARSLSNGWVLVIVGFVVGLALLLGVVARVHHRGYQLAQAQLKAQSEQLNLNEGELADRTRLLEEYQRRSNSLREELDEIIRRSTAQQVKEVRIVRLLDDALIQMIEGLIEGQPADEVLERFFGVFKRTVPRVFARPEQIRNVCWLAPHSDYLRLLKFYTLPPPEELSDRMCFYIGGDEFKQVEMGPEGKLYLSIHPDDSNLNELEPVVVRLSNRLQDQAEEHPDYLGFFGMIDLPAPYSSYVLVPVSHQYGIMRIESEDVNAFGEAHFTLLRQVTQRFHVALLIHSLSEARRVEGEMNDDD
jgi:hypothetical protein